ncbi:hypothetical protein GCM10017600_51910 [Streptosporangium carneum]|uniref:Uncharacterized protein n=1 Tax=Streptosporangium carneum TaxID=47481 RepID=A0A9W6I5Y1_9ACTN|nr:hypothetical protein GCM10017600_51910 [Streptosporangium carneum]
MTWSPPMTVSKGAELISAPPAAAVVRKRGPRRARWEGESHATGARRGGLVRTGLSPEEKDHIRFRKAYPGVTGENRRDKQEFK